MRDKNLYRAKRIYNEQWAYGNLVIDKKNKPHILEPESVYEDGHHLNIDSDIPMFIKEETLGQYSSFDDFNGIKIFEGDCFCPYCISPIGRILIEELDFDNSGVVQFRNGAFCLVRSNRTYTNLSNYGDWGFEEEYISNVGKLRVMKSNKMNGIVFGNIYDGSERYI